MIFFMNEEENFEAEFEIDAGANGTVELKAMEVDDEMKLVLWAIHKIEKMETIKRRGMVNCGATRNGIHQKIVEELKLPITRGMEFGVVLEFL